jgi:hypothetical protein
MRIVLTCLCTAALLAGCSDDGSSRKRSSSLSKEVEYHAPLDSHGYPADLATLVAAVDAGDQRAVREHAWNLWAAITAPSGERFNGKDLPIWETWYSSADIYGDTPFACDAADVLDTGGEPSGRDFESPRQHFHPGSVGAPPPTRESEDVTSINRFTLEVVEHVCERRYNDAQVLDDLNGSFGAATPIAARTIEDFPRRAIALKPVFEIVKASGVTVLPYWAGTEPAATSNPAEPTPETWRQCVAVVPPGVTAPSTPYVTPCNDVASYPAEVIPIDDFYFFRLTDTEVAEVSDDADLGSGTPASGDYAVLVAMHVTTKEIPGWTWQTFWWSPFPDASPNGADRTRHVEGEWRNYEMCTAYSMTGPPETASAPPVICFNPYLETGLTGLVGTDSNCKTCHRLAAWPNFSTAYQANGLVLANDPALFSDNLKLDFLWSVTRAQ